MNPTRPGIDILLATRNGSRFIGEQLDSLFGQTYQNFRLIVRDDESTDTTRQIVERYRSNYPDRMLIRNNLSRQGACRTFSLLAEESTAPYVAFCDQDDIWRSDKLDLSLAALRRAEAQHGADLPVLVFSDMTVVSEGRQVIFPSLWKQAHVNPARATLGAMLAQNLVSGCTALANRSLILKASPIPESAAMHDSWLGLTAVAFGILHPIHETTVEYRQHHANAFGAGHGGRLSSLLKRLRRDERFRDWIAASRRQAQTFACRYANQLTAHQKTILAAWSNSQNLPALVRHWTLHRNGLRGTSFFNNLGFLVRV